MDAIEMLREYIDDPDRKTTLCNEDGIYLPKWYVIASLMLYQPIDEKHVCEAINKFYQKIDSKEIWFLDEYEKFMSPITKINIEFNFNGNQLLDLSKSNDYYNEIKEYARKIKEFCIKNTLNEKSCPFYRGEKYIDNNTSIIQCELNKGQCSPCNWNI